MEPDTSTEDRQRAERPADPLDGAAVDESPAESTSWFRAYAESATERGRHLSEWLDQARPDHPSIEVAFRWIARDQEIAGGVLGGGLAYRFFFWTLSFSLLSAAGFGFASSVDSNVEQAVEDAGLGQSVADSVATAAAQSQDGRWWLLFSGAFLFLWFSFGLLRALRLVHAAAWRIAAPPLKNTPRAMAVVVVAPFVLLAITAAAGWVRAHTSLPPGVLATLAASLGFGALWLWVSIKLPPPGVRWQAFLPGAVLLAAGLNALHVFTVYFLADKLASSSSLYGTLGLAATALFYLFLVGRGVVWSAELNAVIWDVRHRDAGALPER